MEAKNAYDRNDDEWNAWIYTNNSDSTSGTLADKLNEK